MPEIQQHHFSSSTRICQKKSLCKTFVSFLYMLVSVIVTIVVDVPFVVVIVVVSTSAVATISPVTAYEHPCDIVGTNLYLKSGPRPIEFFDYSSRRPIQTLQDGDNVCYDSWGDNIEAIVYQPGLCSYPIHFQLFHYQLDETTQEYTKKVLIHNNTEINVPYFLFSDLGPSRINGTALQVGKYEVRTWYKDYKSTVRTTEFTVISCMFYEPPNECTTCNNVTQACAGTLCVSQSFLRFTLVYYGDNIWDYGLEITSPTNTTIGSYSLGSDIVPSFDAITGGMVDIDYKYSGCRSIGVWTKNIIYPKNSLTNKKGGTYKIKLVDVEDCLYLTDYPKFKPFELKIYKNNHLKAIYDNSMGTSFEFEVLPP